MSSKIERRPRTKNRSLKSSGSAAISSSTGSSGGLGGRPATNRGHQRGFYSEISGLRASQTLGVSSGGFATFS